MQAKTIEALRDLNGVRHAAIGDPEINSRIAAYELAFRMQSAAPELIDLCERDEEDARRVRRRTATDAGDQGGRAAAARASIHAFATNCLLARRLVERGVRFVNLYHASWDHHSNLDAELAVQLRHGRPAGRGAAQGPEAARPARLDAGDVAVASSAARRWARTGPAART